MSYKKSTSLHKKVNMALPPEVHDLVIAQAEKENRSISNMVSTICLRWAALDAGERERDSS